MDMVMNARTLYVVDKRGDLENDDGKQSSIGCGERFEGTFSRNMRPEALASCTGTSGRVSSTIAR